MQIIVLKVINIKNETMNKKSQHVVPHGNQWAVKGANNEKATKVVDTQREAIKIAREIAINQQTELVVHGKNGQIREKNSYGNDPADIKG
jgi:uncharacterized protein YdaT